MDAQQQRSVIAMELRRLSSSLPPSYRDRFTSELVQAIADSLLDKTVFSIIESLHDMQQMTERNLYQSRQDRTAALEAQRRDLATRNQPLFTSQYGNSYSNAAGDSSNPELARFDECTKEELRKIDMRIIMDLDQQIVQQQMTLERAGVPGFAVTNKAEDIRMQMYILDFINKIQARLQ
uniref:Protein DGCR6 n=1 Tax=Plectus sambesii TaxID=2011161 RepID=A0A914X1L6_9BILA